MARVIVRAIRNGDPPGRFLRKDEKTGKWVDIGDKKAAEKTSQALREKTSEERETTKEISGGMLFPSPDSYLEPFLGSLRAATLLAVEAGSLMTVEAAASAASEAATPSAGAGEGKDNSEEGKVPPDEKAGDAAESSKGTNTFDTEMV